jgi:tetratricopeptide (TPR) repeat protein
MLWLKSTRVLSMLMVSIASFVWSPQEAQACGGGGYSPNFIDRNQPNVLPLELLASKFRGDDYFRMGHWDQSDTEADAFESMNLKDWAAYFGTDIDTARSRVYRREGISSLSREVRSYLDFVHTHEGLVSQDTYWLRTDGTEQEKLAIAAQFDIAFAEARAALERTRDPFIRLRWLFVGMRLAHYSMQYDSELELYEQHSPALKGEASLEDSEVWHWVDALLAGRAKVLARTSRERAEAAYRFALLFDASVSKRTEAWISFSIRTDEEWQMLMELAQDDEERALMHVIRALHTSADRLSELRFILDLAPDSPWVNELMAWELEYAQIAGEEHMVAFRSLIDDIVSKEKRSDLFLARFAQLYLGSLQGEDVSVSDVDRLQATYRHDPRSSHLGPFRFYLYVASLEKISQKTEKRIGAKLTEFEGPDSRWWDQSGLRPYVYEKLAPLYERSGETAKYWIASDQLNEMAGRSLGDLNIYQTFVERTDHNSFEAMLAEDSKREAPTKQQVHQRRGIIALDQGAYRDAAAEFASSGDGWFDWRGDPFASGLRIDNWYAWTWEGSEQPACHHYQCYAEEMQRLLDRVAGDPTDARAHLRLGHGLYNRGGVGNMHEGRWYAMKPSAEALSGALSHYESALAHAVDDEVRAEALYSLAKIEFVGITARGGSSRFWHGYSDSPWSDEGLSWLKNEGFGEHFRALRDYEHTSYYSEVISECAVFSLGTW